MGAKLIITIDLTRPEAEAARLERIATELRVGRVPLSELDPLPEKGSNETPSSTGDPAASKRGPAGVGNAILETTQSARKGLTIAEIAERIRQSGRPITNLQVTKSAWRLKSLGKLKSRGDKSDPKNFQYIHPDTLLLEAFGAIQDRSDSEDDQDREGDRH